MQLSLSMSNVLHQALGSKINVIYQPIQNVFDHLLFLACRPHNFFILDKQDIQYNTDNSIVLPASHIHNYGYNLFLSNNPFGCVENNLAKTMHINTAICIHAPRPTNLKKEDREIINKQIWSYNKIFFHANHLIGWQLHNKNTQIPYGVPLDHFTYLEPCKNRKKDVLLLGDESNVMYRMLQQFLLEHKYSCETKKTHMSDLASINSLYNEYKIIIDLTNTGFVNCLCAIAAGCYAIHNTDRISQMNSLIEAQSLENTMATVDNLLKTYESVDHLARIQEDRLSLKTDYNFDIFADQLNTVIESLSKKEVYVV